MRAIRNIEIALGDSEKGPTLSELKNRGIARQSIVASKPIAKGEVFSCKNISTKRPGDGLSPMLWDEIIGKMAVRDFGQDEQIHL